MHFLIILALMLAIANAKPALIFDDPNYHTAPVDGSPQESNVPRRGPISLDWVREITVPAPVDNRTPLFPFLFHLTIGMFVNPLYKMAFKKPLWRGTRYHVPIPTNANDQESLDSIATWQKTTVTLAITIHNCVDESDPARDVGIQLGIVEKGTFRPKTTRAPVFGCGTVNRYSQEDQTGNGKITGREWRIPIPMPMSDDAAPNIYAEIAKTSTATTFKTTNAARVYISWRYIHPDGRIYTPGSIRATPGEASVVTKVYPVVALYSEYDRRISDYARLAALVSERNKRFREYLFDINARNAEAAANGQQQEPVLKQLTVAEMQANQKEIIQLLEAAVSNIMVTYGLQGVPRLDEYPYMVHSIRNIRQFPQAEQSSPSGRSRIRDCFPLLRCWDPPQQNVDAAASEQTSAESMNPAISSVQNSKALLTKQGSASGALSRNKQISRSKSA